MNNSIIYHEQAIHLFEQVDSRLILREYTIIKYGHSQPGNYACATTQAVDLILATGLTQIVEGLLGRS